MIVFLTLGISTPLLVQTSNFGNTWLGSSQSATQTLDALTAVLFEILTFQLMSFLVLFLTLSISEQKKVEIPNFEKELLRSRLSFLENLDALTPVLFEILTFQ